MERKEVPPPYYDAGFVNQPHGQPPPQPMQPPIMTQPIQPQPTFTSSTSTSVVIGGGVAGGCPVCHNMSWTGDYSCCAWLWCICCFPIGIVCCLCMRRKKCTKCGFTVG